MVRQPEQAIGRRSNPARALEWESGSRLYNSDAMPAPHNAALPTLITAFVAGVFALLPRVLLAVESVPLRMATELSPAPAPVATPAFARADSVRGRIGQETVFTGNAELRRGGTRLRGDQITYRENDDEAFASGAVRLARDGLVFTGPELELRLDSMVGHFERAEFSIPAVSGRGSARRIDFIGRGKLAMFDTSYSTCTPERPAWFVRASMLNYDKPAGVARTRDAKIDFFGTTIMELPELSFPIGEGRHSGFLLPTGRVSSRTGLSVSAPYYWDLAPNRDLTLYPRLLTRRGVQVGGLFRYLEPEQAGEVRLEALPGDRSAGRDRWFASATNKISDWRGWSGGWTVRGVSDDNYFADFSTSILGASERSLPREAFLTRTLGDWTVLARAASYQNILEARAAPPYSRVPQLAANWDLRDLKGFDLASGFDLSRFERPIAGSAAGWRAVAHPTVAWSFRSPGAFLVPRLGLHASAYYLDSNVVTPGIPGDLSGTRALNRFLPTLSMDSGLVFERPMTWTDQRVWTQTLEPRIFYVRTPYRDQSKFPLFDTAQADFNFAQLFSNNTFVGNDRIADVNQLTTALLTRFLDPATGREALRFGIGQRLYFEPQRVTIAGEAPRSDTRSDLLAAGGATINPGWTVDGGMQANLAEARVPRFNFATRWNPRPEHIVNLAYRYRRDLVDQIDVSAQWPVSERWYLLGRFNWTLAEIAGIQPGLVESLAGAEYREDCWATRVVFQQYVTSAISRTTAVSLQLELSGLAKIGSDPSAILSRSIPGWRVRPDREISTGRYFGYE
jgi:LPS-assembly protein